MQQSDKNSAGSGHESLSPEDLNARLIQVLESSSNFRPTNEEDHIKTTVRDSSDSPSSEHQNKKRFDSPSDAFKEVFSEYGAKLSPNLRSLQISGQMPDQYDDMAQHEEDEDQGLS